MLKITDYMIDYVNNNILDNASITKDEFKVFDNYIDLALYIHEGDFKYFLNELDAEFVNDEDRSLLENYFYNVNNIFQDESFEYIYYLEI